MPSRREQLLRESLAAYNAEGSEALVRLMTEDAVWAEDPEWPDGATWHGREGVRQVLAERLETATISVEVEGIEERGDRMLVLQRWRIQGSGSGIEADTHVAVINRWNGERIERVDFFLEQDRARAAFDDVRP
jgi:ketosteroid isomerase-like protein